MLPNGIFDVLTKLETLNLGNNNITTLPNGIFDALTKLQKLGLYGNPLICNCPLVDIVLLVKRRRLQWILGPSCHSPVTLRKTLLKDLKLQEVICDSDSTTGSIRVETRVPGTYFGSI
ncbi:leucine-rich repeat transmembrane protein FLRT3-like isoform X2 [Ostrea edulis]|uniref:leucine-rich repeat transmembrane protein FLRT3-like isoform X2 n=1 Tax=Ostrea edulis TaxID=37623 RepID=UPI0024AF9636|nr:leucine-rich repeat transmembrane protein FLRT3-like isoform X2 [Ostrea edulis]